MERERGEAAVERGKGIELNCNGMAKNRIAPQWR